MIRFAVLMTALAACISEGAIEDGGTPLPACRECGPGALIAGRFVHLESGWQPVVANRQGIVVRIVGDRLAWLDETFTVDALTTFDQSLIDVALDDDGGGAVVAGAFRAHVHHDTAVICFGADHTQTWRDEISDATAKVAASPTMIAIMTDAKQIDGTTIDTTAPHTQTLVGLRASDGSVAWHKRLSGSMAFAPDGTLLVTGMFEGTLDLGGSTTPLTTTGSDGFIAALDPMTGDGRWVVQLPGNGTVVAGLPTVTVGPSGEVAVPWMPDIAAEAVSLTLVEPTGVVRWTQPLDVYPTSMVTDGHHVMLTSPAPGSAASIAQYSESGRDWQRPITGTGRHDAQVHVLAGDRLIGSILSAPDVVGAPAASTTVGDVSYPGNGVAFVELAH